MKKAYLILLFLSFILLGCENIQNTPVNKVESFLGKYQKMDNIVLDDLDRVINMDKDMTKEQKEEYKKILEKQYQNLSYKIKKEEIENDKAIVDVEIEVLDYKSSLVKSENYYKEHPNEFKKQSEYTDYKINNLKTVTDKQKQDITFYLKKEKGLWSIEELSEIDIQKLHGLY